MVAQVTDGGQLVLGNRDKCCSDGKLRLAGEKNCLLYVTLPKDVALDGIAHDANSKSF